MELGTLIQEGIFSLLMLLQRNPTSPLHSPQAQLPVQQDSRHLSHQVSRYLQVCVSTRMLQYGITNNAVCATNKVSDQPAHTRSLIRAFASHLKIL